MKNERKPQTQKAYVPKERYGASGYGKHADRRTKRNRTRATQKRRAIGEWN